MDDKFTKGQWVVAKSFEDWYEVAANSENFNPASAREWFDLEWPKNVLKIEKVREADAYDDDGAKEISPFLYFHEDNVNVRTGYSFKCFRHLTTEEQDLMDVLFG